MDGQIMEFDLGTEFEIRLCDVSENKVQNFIAALEATTTLMHLTVNFLSFVLTAQNNRRIVSPLCRSLSNLRRHNQNHPLHILTLFDADAYLAEENGMSNVLEQFLIAAKQFGVPCLSFLEVDDLQYHLLEQFCRGNNSLNCLTMCDVSLIVHGTTTTTTTSGLSNDGPQDSAGFLSLEMLNLEFLWFRNSTAATKFANMLAHLSVQCLLIGQFGGLIGPDTDDDDMDQTVRIVADFKFPTAACLTLLDGCQLNHFKAALEAGTTSLFVCIDCCKCVDEHAQAKLNHLASFFCCTANLNSLCLHTKVKPEPDFFQAMAACATVLHIQMHSDGRIPLEQRLLMIEDPDDLSLFEQHLLGIFERGTTTTTHEEIATRNRFLAHTVVHPSIRSFGPGNPVLPEQHLEEGLAITPEEIVTRNGMLATIVANPSNHSLDEMLALMCQFDNCPTGRYLMALCLPTVVPFQILGAPKKKTGTTNTPAA